MQRNVKLNRMPLKLEKAIKKNNAAVVKAILDQKKFQDPEWLNAVNGSGRTPLLLAAKYKSWDVVKLLLTYQGTYVNASDHYDMSVLAYAVSNLEVVNLLLDDKRSHKPDLSSAQRLLLTYYKNDVHYLSLLQKLFAKGVDVNITFGGNATALWWACVNNQVNVVRYLLSLSCIDVNKGSPLTQMTSFYYHLEIVNLLLAHPYIDVNARTEYARSPLDAVFSGNNMNAEIVACTKAVFCHPNIDKKWLEQSGCDFLVWLHGVSQKLFNQVVNLASTNMFSIEKSKRYYDDNKYRLHIDINLVEAIDILINDPDFDINTQYSNGQTLLTMTISEGLDVIVGKLLACPRIDLHRQDRFGHSALTQADACGRKDLVTTIMQHPRFKLLATYHQQQNLLMHAVEKDCVRLATKVLALNEFPIDQVDANGNTALNLLAQHHKDPQDASLFIDFVMHGADPARRNNLGSNAIMSAENNNLKGIASDLKNTVQAVLPVYQEAVPSAPPLSVNVDVYSQVNAAAQQPPQGYYAQGLFGGSNAASLPPQEDLTVNTEAGNTISL